MQRLTNKLFGAIAAGAMMLLMAAPSLAQVAVSIENTVEGEAGETGAFGVFVGPLDGEDVLSYEFTVEYDASIITITDVNAAGTLSDGISVESSSPSDGTFQVAGASGTALEGSGPLIWLEYEFEADGSSDITLADFTFNDGEPAITTADVGLRLPDTGAEPDVSFKIPVWADDIAGEGVLGYEFTVSFDEDVVVLDGIQTSGTLSENASVAFNAETGSIQVAGATGEGFDSNGVLVFLTGTSGEAGSTALTFSDISLNEGQVESVGLDGSIEVGVGLDKEGPREVPGSFALHGNYPNPFNPSTTIRFDLPEAAQVSVEIYDVLGRQVMALPATSVQAGADRSMEIDASTLTSGTYVYRVIARSATDTMVRSGQMTLVK